MWASLHPCVQLPIYVCISSSIYASPHLHVHLLVCISASMCASPHPCVHLLMCISPSIYTSPHPCMHLPIHVSMSLCASPHPRVHPPIHTLHALATNLPFARLLFDHWQLGSIRSCSRSHGADAVVERLLLTARNRPQCCMQGGCWHGCCREEPLEGSPARWKALYCSVLCTRRICSPLTGPWVLADVHQRSLCYAGMSPCRLERIKCGWGRRKRREEGQEPSGEASPLH